MPSIPKFSYNVTRDYPYKWFTPTAIVGGIILTALFSSINFFSTAYNMVSVTTDQPQKIEAGPYGCSYAHLFASKIQPKCENAVLTFGSTIRTNQSLFEYNLVSTANKSAPSMPYHGEAIDECWASRVMLDFSTWYNRPANQINVSAWGLAVTIDLYCYINTQDGLSVQDFYLQTRIDPIKDASLSQSISSDIQSISISEPTWAFSREASHASKWAQLLMLMFWKDTIVMMTHQTTAPTDSKNPNPRHNLTHGYVQLNRLSDRSGPMQDDRYYDVASWVFFDAITNEKHADTISAPKYTNVESYTQSSTWPQIWSPVDQFAKAALSAVYIDLGLSSAPNTSMVSDADTLRYWSANLSSIANQSSVYLLISDFIIPVTPTDYDAQQKIPTGLGALPNLGGNKTSRATISTTYLCQRPQLKPPFNIFISILVADLVFLRTAWTLYNFVVAYFLKSRHPDANICDKCLARKEEDDEQVDGNAEAFQVDTETAHTDKVHEVDEHTIELDYLEPPSPAIRQDDQGSSQSLLSH